MNDETFGNMPIVLGKRSKSIGFLKCMHTLSSKIYTCCIDNLFRVKTLLIILFIIILAYPVFHNLGALPMRSWDESRLSANAYAMYKNSNYLVTYFDHQPDLWNTKPPFQIWLQCIGMHIFDDVEFAIRFPSALAVIILIIVYLVFSKLIFQNYMFGILSSIITVTANGYVEHHTARTGDYDSLLTTCIISFALFLYLFAQLNKKIYFSTSILCLTIAVMCKSIAGMFFIPFSIIYFLYKKKLWHWLSNAFLWRRITFFIVIILGFIILREYASSGFINAVIMNDLGLKGRFFNNDITQPSNDYFYYLKLFFEKQFTYWIYFLPLCIILLFVNNKYKNLFLFLLGNLIFFELIISLSKTKFYWYNMPGISLLAMLTTLGIVNILDKLKQLFNLKYYSFFCVIVIFVISLKPYKILYKKSLQTTDGLYTQLYDIPYTYLFYNALQNNTAQQFYNYKLIKVENYHWFYMYFEMIQDKGIPFTLCEIDSIQIGDKVLFCDTYIKKQLEVKKLHYNVLKTDGVFTFAEIIP